MWFWFKKTEKNYPLFQKKVLFGLLGFFLVLFLIKTAMFWRWVTGASFETILRPLEVASVSVSWIAKNTGHAWLLVWKMLEKWPSSLSKDEFSKLFWLIAWGTLNRYMPSEFSHLTYLLAWVEGFGEDFYSLLWFEGEQRYLVVLQNTSEKRPNWWFFWSFALVKIDRGQVTHLEIVDSYLPWYDKPNTTITWPEWFNEFLPDRTIHFVWANKVWFTYHDWAHIKTLYEKSYPWQKIRWVVFLRTDMFKQLLPDFEKQLRERQFANAAVDLIRWEDRWWKKETYLKSSQAFFEQNKTLLAKNFLEQLPQLLEKHRINFYLIDISGPLHWYLRRNNLTTRFEQETAYFWDSNISFNKIDQFIDKEVTCFDEKEKVFINELNKDIISLLALTPGERTCKIKYTLFVDEQYTDYIQSLETQYWIKLWWRELHILWLNPARDWRGVVHFPKNIDIFQITWDTYESEFFETPFSNALMYKSLIQYNWWSANVFVRFRVNEINN